MNVPLLDDKKESKIKPGHVIKNKGDCSNDDAYSPPSPTVAAQNIPPSSDISDLRYGQNGQIRVIDFEDFKKVGEIPRFSHNQNPQDTYLPTIAKNFSTIDFTDCLAIFVSHCWLRGHDNAPGWSGRPHPDDVGNSKYKLCVEGIEKLKLLAPDARRMFLWFDFSCLDQDGDPVSEMKYLDTIIGWSDIIFTPIVDDDHASWEMPITCKSLFEAYKAKAWQEGDYAYQNRGWCRVEMLYACTIPLAPHAQAPARMASLKAGLKHAHSNGRRLHVLYGSKESEGGLPPRALPPLQDSYFDAFNPLDGHVTDPEKVRPTLERLMTDLKAKGYVKRSHVGYQGERDGMGRQHGRGTEVFVNGDVYEGDWVDNKQHGKGLYRYADGDVYEGDWMDHKKHGKGEMRFASGAVYNGDWADGKRHGKGVYHNADGAVYNGNWVDGKRHGKGVIRYADGDVHEGDLGSTSSGSGAAEPGVGGGPVGDGVGVDDWVDGKQHGKGVCCKGVCLIL